jgi:uncharacterized protein GlcG (DUF336 family)
MANAVKKYSISFELAQKMVDAAVAKAREIGVSENVAILDDGGNLKAFSRMDGAPIPTIEMAQNKAYKVLFTDPSKGCSCKGELDGADRFAFEEFGVRSEAESFQQLGLHLL